MTLLVLLYAALGGLWRRIFGGWHNNIFPKLLMKIASPLLVLPVWHVAGFWVFAVVAGLSLLFWVYDHDIGSNKALWKRYGPIALCWILCRRYWKWSRPGWSEAAEVFAGFFYYLIVNGVSVAFLA